MIGEDELTDALAAMESGAPPRRWPATAAEMLAVAGSGTWASAWQCDESSGNLADAYGAVPLTAEISPLYRQPGAFPGDYGVGVDTGSSDRFTAGSTDSFNLDGVTSIGIYICIAPTTTVNKKFIGKVGPNQWALLLEATGAISALIADGVDLANPTVAVNHADGKFHDILMCLDRTAERIQVFTDLGTSAAVDSTLVGTLTNANFFHIGATPADTTFGATVAFAAVATGDIVNLRANGATVLANLRRFTGRG